MPFAKETVAVTGANSLLGTNTVIELLRNQYRVIALVRDRGDFMLQENDQLKVCEYNLMDGKTFEEVLKKSEAVVHIAADTRHDHLSYGPYKSTNVQGTASVVTTAVDCNIRKFIFVSTANTKGHGSFEQPGHEGRTMRSPFSGSFYAKSKAEAEELVLSRKHQMHVVLLNPTFMIGPFDSKPSSGKIVMMGYGKKIVFHPPGGKNFVAVKDAARGVVAALEKGRNGEAYILAHENISYRQFFKKLATKSPADSILVQLPASVLRAAGLCGDLLRSMGLTTSISSVNMKMLNSTNFYSNQKSVEELGVRYTPVDEAIEDAISWFKEKQML